MKNLKLIYIYFLSGVLFLITAGAFYSTENSNLTPAFASIGFAIISISLVFYSRYRSCKNQNKT
ncbi:hypothetical protein theurythT_31570 [Thalassotalea eurytherma]|uniref:Uncharacterized protein n=1 Tax=Thalassotalea eurytherma TaxID=1144278 RepID=A0ABQ6H8A6_9GAMM|nr:hypothetical protein theurythT_31570 [Thalassotalea eurytherma]